MFLAAQVWGMLWDPGGKLARKPWSAAVRQESSGSDLRCTGDSAEAGHSSPSPGEDLWPGVTKKGPGNEGGTCDTQEEEGRSSDKELRSIK